MSDSEWKDIEAPEATIDETVSLELEELSDWFPFRKLQPGDFTIKDIMAKFDVSYETAYDRLRKMREAGVVEKVCRIKNVTYYRRVK